MGKWFSILRKVQFSFLTGYLNSYCITDDNCIVYFLVLHSCLVTARRSVVYLHILQLRPG